MSVKPQGMGEEIDAQAWEDDAERRRRNLILDLYSSLHKDALRTIFWCMAVLGVCGTVMILWIMFSIVVEYSGNGWLADWQVEAIQNAAIGIKDAFTGAGLAGFLWLYVYRRFLSNSGRQGPPMPTAGNRADADPDPLNHDPPLEPPA